MNANVGIKEKVHTLGHFTKEVKNNFKNSSTSQHLSWCSVSKIKPIIIIVISHFSTL